ncbi:MAG: hypothetical protein ACJ8GJ_10450 [Vitreoscilla sp.]
MKNKSLAILSPLCLCLFAGSAWAELEPFSFGASENLQHQSNLGHSPTNETADWISTTEFSAGINEPVGRDKLVASAAVNFNRYKRLHSLNSTGYQAGAEFDWNTIGDLSGALGVDSHRRQYFYGETSEFSFLGEAPTTVLVRNLQTDNHAFARVTLGGQSRWSIFGGADANRRNFSNEAFHVADQRQWSTNLGTRYATSPDLAFGVTGTYVRGDYPQGSITGTQSNFNSKSAAATTRWQVSGNTMMDGSLGYTAYYSDAFGGTRHFMNGTLNWVWKPPSHLTFTLGLKRSADADTSSVGITNAPQGASSLNGTSINTGAHLDATYAFTPKTSLSASTDYTERKYEDLLTVAGPVSGTTRTARFFLTVHYLPTRTTDVSCGAGRETRHADASLFQAAPGYNDNYVQCLASIHFD